MCAIFTLWKGEGKFTSDTFRTDYINILTVSLNGFLYDGKTKSGSFFIFATRRICLVKTFPYFIHASLHEGSKEGRAYTKVIKMVKSPKTGAYVFDEQMVPNEKVQDFFKK